MARRSSHRSRARPACPSSSTLTGTIFRIDADGTDFLRDEKSWLTAKALNGDWQPAAALPESLSKLPDEDNWKDARAAMPPVPFADGTVPKVVYSDRPAELINFSTASLSSNRSRAPASNGRRTATATCFSTRRAATGTCCSPAAGSRRNRSRALGPSRRPTCRRISRTFRDDAPYASVRSSVPKTFENAEARLKASIPQMARVSTDGSVKVDVAYSGDPKFEPIEGTSLKYAVNTNETVIQVGTKYFVLKDGVWFVGDSLTGPFVVATAVPDEIYTIPASSPVYNATYVRVYSTEPGAVWFGYTMGYLGAYLAWTPRLRHGLVLSRLLGHQLA